MRIYVVRHGYAGNYIGQKVEKRPEDLKRKLQPDGIEAVSLLADWLVSNDEAPTVIFASPVTRADQTAQILAKGIFGDAKKYTSDQNLEIGKPIEMVIAALLRDPSMSRPLIVSHSDTIPPALRRMNGLDSDDVDPIAMSELRILKVGRSSGQWKEKKRVLPSDLGSTDYY